MKLNILYIILILLITQEDRVSLFQRTLNGLQNGRIGGFSGDKEPKNESTPLCLRRGVLSSLMSASYRPDIEIQRDRQPHPDGAPSRMNARQVYPDHPERRSNPDTQGIAVRQPSIQGEAINHPPSQRREGRVSFKRRLCSRTSCTSSSSRERLAYS
jgi:hypothetical protein